jgi:hypothetical protein
MSVQYFMILWSVCVCVCVCDPTSHVAACNRQSKCDRQNRTIKKYITLSAEAVNGRRTVSRSTANDLSSLHCSN